jgi:hypothetical protein
MKVWLLTVMGGGKDELGEEEEVVLPPPIGGEFRAYLLWDLAMELEGGSVSNRNVIVEGKNRGRVSAGGYGNLPFPFRCSARVLPPSPWSVELMQGKITFCIG